MTKRLLFGMSVILSMAIAARHTKNTIHFARYPIDHSAFRRQDIFQDILIVSAFVVWASILGLLPVLVIGSLITT